MTTSAASGGWPHGQPMAPPTPCHVDGAPTPIRLIRAARVIFAQKGFHATSLNEVAHAAGVSRPAIRYYFHTKTALFAAVVDDVEATVLTPHLNALQAERSPTEQLRELLAAIASDGIELRSAISFLITAAIDGRRYPDLGEHICGRLTGLRSLVQSQLREDTRAAGPAPSGDAAVEVMLSLLWGWAVISR